MTDKDELLGYRLVADDNGSNMCCSSEKVLAGVRALAVCRSCGYRIDYEFLNPDFVLQDRSFDLSYTFDGYCVASERFREIAHRHLGVELLPLERESGYYILRSSRVVECDRDALVQTNQCGECGFYESVHGHVLLNQGFRKPLGDGFFRTDVRVGSGNEKSFPLIVGENTKMEIEKADLLGVGFRPLRLLSEDERMRYNELKGQVVIRQNPSKRPWWKIW